MTATKPTAGPFDLAAILSITHSLPIEAAPHVELLEWITGQEMYGPVFALGYRELCVDWLTAAHPQLRDLTKPDFHEDDYAAQDAWVDEVAAQLGARTLPVAPMPADQVRPKDIIDVLGDAGALHKTYVVPAPENG
ncbi:hypothetical protein [Streptomyces niveus]|uniref:hypothetical protein n=1 Tax=Streptomyces niveus TaxID=193462 RepID=UPI00343F7961